jgi:hypothetical protein
VAHWRACLLVCPQVAQCISASLLLRGAVVGVALQATVLHRLWMFRDCSCGVSWLLHTRSQAAAVLLLSASLPAACFLPHPVPQTVWQDRRPTKSHTREGYLWQCNATNGVFTPHTRCWYAGPWGWLLGADVASVALLPERCGASPRALARQSPCPTV